MAPEHVPSLRGRATITTVVTVVVLIVLCLVVWMYRNTPPFSHFLGSGVSTSTQAGASDQQWQKFSSSEFKFSVQYPQVYTVDTAYIYEGLGSGKEIRGVKFIIPASFAEGTNLSTDSYVSIETVPNTENCSAALFLATTEVLDVTVDGIKYSVAQQSGAAAGNLYNETIFTLSGSSPCTAVRYFIHSTQIGNYPEGTVTEFDRSTLVSQFDQVRKSLKLER